MEVVAKDMDDDDFDARIWTQFVRTNTETNDTSNPTFFQKRKIDNESTKYTSSGRDT